LIGKGAGVRLFFMIYSLVIADIMDGLTFIVIIPTTVETFFFYDIELYIQLYISTIKNT